MKHSVSLFLLLTALFSTTAQAIWYGDQTDKEKRACLFAHMMEGDYGRLYYAVSLDGMIWKSLNGGKRVKDDYRGHPDITKGPDGSYYLIGNDEDRKVMRIWQSKDLIEWKLHADYAPDFNILPQHHTPRDVGGAPKIFFDIVGQQFVITWHGSPYPGEETPGNHRWSNMRTLYVTTKDFKKFSDPKRLFQFDLPTIDVILRRDGDLYYAIIKDEGIVGPTHTTGKTVRVTWAPSLDGPWIEPTDKILPNWCEAPTAIVNPSGKGWMVYAERYSAIRYELAVAPTLKGPWTNPIAMSYKVPEKAKHGGMINITRAEYDKLVEEFGIEE